MATPLGQGRLQLSFLHYRYTPLTERLLLFLYPPLYIRRHFGIDVIRQALVFLELHRGPEHTKS